MTIIAWELLGEIGDELVQTRDPAQRRIASQLPETLPRAARRIMYRLAARGMLLFGGAVRAPPYIYTPPNNGSEN